MFTSVLGRTQPGIFELGNVATSAAPPTQEATFTAIDVESVVYGATAVNPSTATSGVTQVLVEAAAHGEQGFTPPAIVITQDALEWALHNTDNAVVVTQAAVEWALHPATDVVVTQAVIEVAFKRAPRLDQVARYRRPKAPTK